MMPRKEHKNLIADFRRIVERYTRGGATLEEIDFLNLYYEELGNRSDILSSLSAEEVQEIAGRIKNNIAAGVLNSAGKRGKVIGMRKTLVWAAALTGILLAGVFGYLFIVPQDTQQTVTNQSAPEKKTDDIAPGGSKAILTLADGTQVILDSADNGAVTNQGKVTIIKLSDGQLAYKNGSTSPVANLQYNTISTPRGGQYQLTLADGTRVWLNAESSLKYPTAFSAGERRVTLTGEGYFEVAHDAKNPFFVKASGTEVKVLGTHFDVNAYEDESSVNTTLLEGSVKVTSGGGSKMITPGEQAQVNDKGRIHTSRVDVNEVVAWKDGKFIFEKADIHDVMKQISRWYDVDVEYRGNISGHFGGTISKNVHASKVLEMLEFTGGVHFKIEGKKVIVMP